MCFGGTHYSRKEIEDLGRAILNPLFLFWGLGKPQGSKAKGDSTSECVFALNDAIDRKQEKLGLGVRKMHMYLHVRQQGNLMTNNKDSHFIFEYILVCACSNEC